MKATFKRIGIILLISGVAAWVANSVHPRKIPWVQDWSIQVEAKAAKQKIKVIPLSVALEKFKALESIFIDARPPAAFEKGHVPRAVSIPFQSLEDHLSILMSLIDSDLELVVYCKNRTCDDALLLASELQAMGASHLVLYIDGFDAWKKYGGATSSSTNSYRAADDEAVVPPTGALP
jgi:rhodanese-related sulfurtransferase